MKTWTLLYALAAFLATPVSVAETAQASDEQTIQAAVEHVHRSEHYTARDMYRHPAQTLRFFELKPSDTVVEIWPGGGWYAEILAPLLKTDGLLIAAHFDPESGVPFFRKMRAKFEQKVKATESFNRVELSVMQPPQKLDIANGKPADKVLTFRNVHNWMKSETEQAVFNSFYKALKPGGLLGVVEHRAKPGTSLAAQIKSGYVTEAYVKQLANKAGFEFVASSEVNANAQDTKDYFTGVWALPPTLRVKEHLLETQKAIGESDRMTLKFRKPLK